MPDGPSAPLPGERARFRPLAPPVAVWAAFMGGVAGVAAAAGSRAVGRLWAWRWAGGSWAASSTSRRSCGPQTDTTSPGHPGGIGRPASVLFAQRLRGRMAPGLLA